MLGFSLVFIRTEKKVLSTALKVSRSPQHAHNVPKLSLVDRCDPTAQLNINSIRFSQ